MKNIFFVVAFIFMSVASCISQNIPQVVASAFQIKFPKATNIKWGKENAHEYEAEFKIDGIDYSANFSGSGEWLETEISFTFDQLPTNVKAAFNSSHKDAKVKEVAKIETSKGITKYELEIKQGVKTVDILYNTEGLELK